MTTLSQFDEKEIAETIVGRSIVSIVDDVITLDNGKKLTVIPNEGCSGCTSGYYYIDELNNVENVITSVKLTEEEVDDKDNYELSYRYNIFVYTGGSKNKKGVKSTLLSVLGTDGNGYYGSGYELIVS